MSGQHAFLLTPAEWLGEGKIKLSMVEEELNFYTRWKLSAPDGSGHISALQEVQIQGFSDVMLNQFFVFDLISNYFNIELENAALGKLIGKGIIKENLIGWEFRSSDAGFEGFEFYEKQNDGAYLMRAEYATADQYRTIIKGKIWQKKAINEKVQKAP